MSDARTDNPDPLAAPPAGGRAVIFGCAGPEIDADEKAFFRDANPVGFILFSRNVETPEQLRRLTEDLRSAVGWRAPILIDQEGGRVARLRGPVWAEWAPVGALSARVEAGDLSEEALAEALRLRYAWIADELRSIGVDVNCAPLLDVRQPQAHDIIGDRALGFDPERVARRGRAVADGLLSGGVAPVIKHLPGHGRADLDSHLALPRVAASRADLEAADLPPFRALADQPFGMTAHIVYEAIDPERCATLSPVVIGELIRGAIGFDGALMTDDLSMRALEGPFRLRAEQSLAAGCDLVLHCNGAMAEMTDTAAGVAPLEGVSRDRMLRALKARRAPQPFDREAALARLGALGAGPLSRQAT
ncbi:MAG: beta-N-acetylhexosaminidase [Pseudomonadota bacterium]